MSDSLICYLLDMKIEYCLLTLSWDLPPLDDVFKAAMLHGDASLSAAAEAVYENSNTDIL